MVENEKEVNKKVEDAYVACSMGSKVFVYSYKETFRHDNETQQWGRIYTGTLKDDIVGIQMMPNGFLYWSKDQAKLALKSDWDPEKAYDLKLKGAITDTDFSPEHHSKFIRTFKMYQKLS